MNKTKIEWTDYSWNPIKGLCPVGCWYCYAKDYYKRFKMNPEIRLDAKSLLEPNMLEYKPSKIFVCSTIEIFHPQIQKEWRDEIFDVIKDNPQHTFQILTKLPENIDRDMPDNVWLGVSVTQQDDLERINSLKEAKAKIKFVSFEPLLEEMPKHSDLKPILKDIDWVIIGRLIGYGNEFNPKQQWIYDLTNTILKLDIPLFMKNNLTKMPLWKEFWDYRTLIQEFPK